MSSVKTKGLQQTVVGSTTQPLHIGGISEDFSDAIITINSDGSVDGISSAEFLTATIPSASWTTVTAPNGTGVYYTRAVTVNGILSTDKPDISLTFSGTYATDLTRMSNFASLWRAVTSTDTITFYSSSVPSADIPIEIRVIR